MNNSDMPATACEVIEKTTNSMGAGTKRVSYKGLTKREAFAMAAMQGMCANQIPNMDSDYKELSINAVATADALLKELDKE